MLRVRSFRSMFVRNGLGALDSEMIHARARTDAACAPLHASVSFN